MSDPWSVVGVRPIGDGGGNEDEWSVRSFTPPKGTPVVKPRKRSLKERFADNFEAGREGTLFGAAADALAANIPGPEGAYEREKNRDKVDAYEQISKADPWYEAPGGLQDKVAAGAATLGGILAGGATSPEAVLGAGKTIVGRIAANAGINAALDVPTQVLQNEAGTHEGFDPWRVVASGATGAVLQGVGEGAAPAMRAAGRAITDATEAAAPHVRRAAETTARVAGDVGRRTGEAVADGWSVVKRSLPQPSRVQSPEEVSAIVREIVPDAQITSTYRDAVKNRRVGGVANSYHTRGRGQALDLVPPKGVTLDQFRAQLAGRGLKVVELLDEGDHWHIAWEGGAAPRLKVEAPEGSATPAQPEWLKALPERGLDEIPNAEQPGLSAQPRQASPSEDADAVGPLVAADRPAANRGSAPTPDRSAGPGDGPAGGGEFIDADHAKLYDVGRRARAGEPVDPAELADLAERMGPRIDWTDHDLTAQERSAWRSEGRVSPDTMLRTARDFADDYDAPEGRGSHVSYYDPDSYAEALADSMRRRAPPLRELPPFPERLQPTPDKDMLSAGDDLPFERLGMFAGRKARTADENALATAKLMARAGEPNEKIRQATGWQRGDDGEWRYEIADNRAVFREAPKEGLFGPQAVGLSRLAEVAASGRSARLDTILDHPKLFEAYPELRRYNVAVEAIGDGAAYLEGRNLVVSPDLIRRPEELRGVILHEIQHAVQVREGFAVGAGADADSLRQFGYGDALRRREEWLRSRGYKTDSAAMEVYRRSAGEIEARNTQARRHMGDQSRRTISPTETRDVPADEAVVVRQRGRLFREQPRAMASDDRRAMVDLSAYDAQLKGSKGGGNVTGARPSKARAIGEGTPEYARQTVSQLADKLRQALGITHRQGRLTLKGGAVGEYDPRSGVIRTRAAKDAIDHLAHEAGHKLQFMRKPQINAAIKAHAAELERLAYEGANPAHRLEEGFAEFFKAYLLNPDEARLRAPNFYDVFEQALAADLPAVAKDLQAIQKAYADLLDAAALEVGAASVALTGKPGPIRHAIDRLKTDGPAKVLLDVADEAYRGIWDQKHPFNVFMRRVQGLAKQNSGARLEVKAAQHPYVMARMADHAFAVAQSDLNNGITPYRGTRPEGPSLKDINRVAFGAREPSQEEFDQFGAYLISRRMRHEWDRYYRGELENAPDKVEQDKAFHERLIEDAEKLHPNWVQAAELATDWNRRQWKLWHDAGFIGTQTYESGIKDHPDYVPLQRDMSDRQAPGGGGSRARGVGQFAGGVDAFVGSQRDIIHPLVSMTRRASEIRSAIARNEVVLSMWNAAQRAGENFGDLIEELPAKQFEMIKVDALDALDAVAKAMGLSERDRSAFEVFQSNELEGAIQAELFRQIEFSPRKDEAVVFAWKDGKKQPLLLPDGKLGRDLFTAISGMTQDTRTLWEEIAARSATALRVGVTGMPEFAVKTMMRDQIAAAILTDVGFIPYLDAARGGLAELRMTDAAKRYEAVGGLKGGVNLQATRRPFVRNDAEARQQIKLYQGRKLPVRSWRDLMHLADYGDTATRVGVYSRAEARALKRGLSPYEAAVEARHTAADFFDPSRHGAWPAIRQAARVIPFFNSGLQGPDVAARVIRHAFAKPETLADKAKFRRAWWAIGKLAATAVLGATLVSFYWSDPDWQNINDQVRATHWPLAKMANGEWLLYPKSFELGMPSNLAERALEWFHTRDPRTVERIGKDILNTSVPTRDAPVLAVPFQAAANRNRNGQPIIPDHLKGKVEPQFEVNPWTSDAARVLAGNRMSPALLEHYLIGFGGTGARDALRLADTGISAARGEPAMKGRAPDWYLTRGFVRRTARGSDAEQNFWKLAGRDGKYEKAANTLRLYVKQGDDAKAEAYIASLPPEVRSYAVAQTLIGGKLAQAHPLVRARNAVSVIGAMRRESRDGKLVGNDNRPIQMTPAQRRAVDDALDDLALVEIHNAQVAAGTPGWANREFMDRREPINRIARSAPPVAQALNTRLAQEGVMDVRAAAQLWQRASVMADSLRGDQLRAFATRARMNTGDERRAEVRRLGAMQAPALASRSPFAASARATRAREPRESARSVRNIFANDAR